MAKPGELPRWSETGGGTQSNITPAPLSGRKDIGFLPGEELPSAWLNWLLNLVYRWLVYVDGLTGEALTWTAAHVFSSRPTFNDGILVSAPTTANRPGVDATGNGTGAGVKGVASSTAGSSGVEATGAGNNPAVRATGSGTGAGAVLTGGSSGGSGATIVAGASNGKGAVISSAGSGAAVEATTTGSGAAVKADASGGTGKGLEVIGGAGATAAILATVISGNGHGIQATGSGSGSGAHFTGGASGVTAAVQAFGGGTDGPGLTASGAGNGTAGNFSSDSGYALVLGGNATRAPLHFTPQAFTAGTGPSSPGEGDAFYNSTDHKLYVYNGTAWTAQT